jgi:tetratricopeptide (TPR) repeat protein
VHRDLKPENVLITPDHVVQVMDLGVALVVDEAMRLSQTGHFLGSVLYAAPEQWALSPDVDARTDLFSVGVMLYELGTGRHPFRKPDSDAVSHPQLADVRPAGRVNPQLSPFFEELVACLMATEASARLASASELANVAREAEASSWWSSRAPALRSSTRRPLRRIRIPRETPLFGRDADVAALRTAYDRAKAGSGGVLLIEGEAGIGKSRLVDEFVGGLEAEGEDVAFLFGSYPPGGAATAAGAFSTAYREYLGAEALDETLARHLTSTRGLVPAFAALLRGEAPPEGSAPLGKASLQTVFIQATRSLAAERPTVVLIDDLHFAPDEGRALFLALSLAVPGHRVLLIGTARTDSLGPWASALERPTHVARRELQRLGARDLTHLLADAFQSESLARQLGFQIAAKSDGNPFFVFEILQDLRRRGALKLNEGRWSTTEALDNITVPSSLIDLVEARLETLDSEDRDLLELAACIGYEFDPSLVAQAAGVPLLPTLKRFGQIESAQRIIRATGRRYAFDHHQIQEALYEKLFVQLREQYHVAIATALEAAEPRSPVDICEHLFRGAAGSGAAPYIRDAVKELEQAHLYGAAAELAERALAIEGLLSGAERIDILQLASSWFERSGHREKERELTEEAYRLAHEFGEPTLIARTVRSRAIRLSRDGKYEEAVAVALEAKRLARDAGSDRVVADAATTAANALLWLGRAEEALALFQESLALNEKSGTPEKQLVDFGNLGRTLALLGEPEKGAAMERRALEMARRHGIAWAHATLCSNLGASELGRGNTAQALALFDEGLALCQQMGDRYSEAIVLVNLGWAHIVLGNGKGARDWLERGIELAVETDSVRVATYGTISLSKLHDRRGERDRARELAETALAARRELNYASGIPEALVQLARVAEDDARATLLLDEAIEHAGAHRQRGWLWLARAFRARVAGVPNEGAVDSAPDEVSLLERLDGCWALYQGTGERRWLDEARAVLDHLRDHAPPEFRDSMLEHVPDYRGIADASATT